MGLATGGSGDTLAGAIAGLLSSRAVLQGFGVGTEGSSATAAVLPLLLVMLLRRA